MWCLRIGSEFPEIERCKVPDDKVNSIKSQKHRTAFFVIAIAFYCTLTKCVCFVAVFELQDAMAFYTVKKAEREGNVQCIVHLKKSFISLIDFFLI
jgi:hypothetical protein